MRYSSVENKKIKELKKLHQKKYRDQTGHFLIEGAHLLEEAKKANVLEEIYYLEGQQPEGTDAIHILTPTVMRFLTTLEALPIVIATCRKLNLQPGGNRILFLDDIQDPGNLGTIIRSAVAFHIDTIFLSEHTVDLYNEKTVRATQGMLFSMPIVRTNLNHMISQYQKEGYHMYATNVEHGKSLKTIDKHEKIGIIMGNEGSGVHKEIQELCDELLYIDISSRCESLNVGIATSIILYELDK